MGRNLKWKAILVVLIIGFALWMGYPPLDIRDSEGNIVEKGKVNLGLDLQGGMHLVLVVDTSDLTPQEAKDAPDRALEIIRNRIDQFGVLEPSIQRQGSDRIVIQLPGVTDRERAIKLLKSTAHLEFRLVSDDPEFLKKAITGEIVPGYELKSLKLRDGKTEELLVEKKASLKGDTLVDATTDFSQTTFNQPYVSIRLNNVGGATFSELTGANVGKRLAIVLDGTVYSAPVIREKIPSGNAQITGNFSVQEANDLAIVLRAGALPAPVKVIEERTVGPTLGKDSIEKGIKAIITGGLIVLLFMAVYYLISGLIADFALILNMVLITGALAYFHATLTLPGIAGLVLTIGMSVDANVLIFERIREEFKLGKSMRAAIQSGFQRAYITILDANITTLITALILFQFGTGPVRGFATVLSIGIISSMFTALVVTRLILDFLATGTHKINKLVMLQFVRNPKINFIGARKVAYVVSVVLIVIGMFTFIKRREANYGIDFTGGVLQQYRFERFIPLNDIRETLRPIGAGDVPIQQFSDKREILIRTQEDNSGQIMGKFKSTFKDNRFEVMRIERVGPSIGKDLRGKAVKTVIFAMIGICLYVSFRFEFRFAIAAIVALLHDVGISLGAIALTHRELSIPVVAALLTIVGYSINDTIVVFDRIREDRKLMRKSTYKEIINASINQTFSRTLLTSLTTLIVVLALYFFGGEVINDFAFVMLVGIISGTYSSIFIASPILIDWPSKRAR
ncbi:MAG: protein translocase subunit SecD [Candidatus Omnitrophica bacterium]|nr:protein translocase subunit SecD [Candidatus Omnitrophota bacterium]